MPYIEIIQRFITRYPEAYIKIMEIAEELTMTKPNGISLPPGTFEHLLLDKLRKDSPEANYNIPPSDFFPGGGVHIDGAGASINNGSKAHIDEQYAMNQTLLDTQGNQTITGGSMPEKDSSIHKYQSAIDLIDSSNALTTQYVAAGQEQNLGQGQKIRC